MTETDWAQEVERLRATGIDTAAIAAILKERGASHRSISTALSMPWTSYRRMVGAKGAERPASDGSGGARTSSTGPEVVVTDLPTAPGGPETVTAAGLIVDELKRAAQFRSRGELDKAAILIDRAQVRGASAEQVHAALSAPFVAPVKDDITAESSAAEVDTRRTQIVGIALAFGLLALGVIAWKLYQVRTAALTELEPATDPAEIDAEARVTEIAGSLEVSE
jgi:hypothetical protein